jgi:ankyrin repeat protein
MDIDHDVLFDAIRNGDVKYIKNLLLLGLDPDYEWNGWTLLKSAVEHEKKDIIGLLLENGADINRVTRGEWTALHQAVDISIDATIQTKGKTGDEPTDILSF